MANLPSVVPNSTLRPGLGKWLTGPVAHPVGILTDTLLVWNICFTYTIPEVSSFKHKLGMIKLLCPFYLYFIQQLTTKPITRWFVTWFMRNFSPFSPFELWLSDFPVTCRSSGKSFQAGIPTGYRRAVPKNDLAKTEHCVRLGGLVILDPVSETIFHRKLNLKPILGEKLWPPLPYFLSCAPV